MRRIPPPCGIISRHCRLWDPGQKVGPSGPGLESEMYTRGGARGVHRDPEVGLLRWRRLVGGHLRGVLRQARHLHRVVSLGQAEAVPRLEDDCRGQQPQRPCDRLPVVHADLQSGPPAWSNFLSAVPSHVRLGKFVLYDFSREKLLHLVRRCWASFSDMISNCTPTASRFAICSLTVNQGL